MAQEQAPRWPGGFSPGSVTTKLDGDFHDIHYSYHTPGLPNFTVTLMVHKACYPTAWENAHAWVDRVGPEFIKTHFVSSWESILSQVRAGERRILLYSQVRPGEDVTK